MADVPQVPVAAVSLAHGKRKIDAMRFAVFNFLLAGIHFPFIRHTPRSDHFNVRVQSLDAQLETDLIIALSCGTVTDCLRIFLVRNLDQFFGNQRAGHAGAQQIAVLINSAGFYARHNVIVRKFIDHIKNI